MSDFEKLLIGITVPSEPIARTELENGIIISTVITSDQGPETAVLDLNGVYPVERYDTIEDAQTGHELWCQRASKMQNGDTITEIGYGGLTDEQDITLNIS